MNGKHTTMSSWPVSIVCWAEDAIIVLVVNACFVGQTTLLRGISSTTFTSESVIVNTSCRCHRSPGCQLQLLLLIRDAGAHSCGYSFLPPKLTNTQASRIRR